MAISQGQVESHRHSLHPFTRQIFTEFPHDRHHSRIMLGMEQRQSACSSGATSQWRENEGSPLRTVLIRFLSLETNLNQLERGLLS